MKTVFTVILSLFSALVVAGSRFEATEGQNVTLFFHIDEVERADLLKITFEDHKEKQVIAQKPWIFEEPPPAGVSLLVERGRVSVTILHVTDSRSGLYEARAFVGRNVLTENVVLVVSKTPSPSSSAPSHTSSPKPPGSSQLLLLYGLIPLVFVISGVACVCKHKRMLFSQNKKRERELEKDYRECATVAMKRENNDDLLTDSCIGLKYRDI